MTESLTPLKRKKHLHDPHKLGGSLKVNRKHRRTKSYDKAMQKSESNPDITGAISPAKKKKKRRPKRRETVNVAGSTEKAFKSPFEDDTGSDDEFFILECIMKLHNRCEDINARLEIIERQLNL